MPAIGKCVDAFRAMQNMANSNYRAGGLPMRKLLAAVVVVSTAGVAAQTPKEQMPKDQMAMKDGHMTMSGCVAAAARPDGSC